ncbi:MAG TPA: histidine kinase, partial [Lachnospiraceae bacterium]|nr:histidine kinase [Lachnospiraceae bacterium]
MLSRRAIAPYVENIISQKQFITNASHELKTPLAIISANAEAIEMIDGKSEWTDNILAQVRRSTDLINSMLALARMSETQKTELTQVGLTDVVR